MSQLDRHCSICGTDLAGRRADALTCSPSCRREHSRLEVLLTGQPAGPYKSLSDYLNRRQKACKTPPKIAAERPPTRTDRATRFVCERCIEQPGHIAFGEAIYSAYLGWCREHEPEPLSRSAFDRVVEAWAPIEGRTTEKRNSRGRPRAAFRGIIVKRQGADEVAEAA